MSICEWLSDRMPSVVLEETQWTPEEARHLGECSACQAEWRLVQATSRMGKAPQLVPDPDATAQAVLLRLERPARFPMRSWGLSALAAAAIGAAVWVGGRGTADNTAEVTSVAAGLPMPLPELDVLQPAELDSVLTTMDDSASSTTSSDDVGLGDLDSEELQRVLDTWEG